MNILFLILLLIAPAFAGETASNLIQEPDDMQTRVKKHLKTNKLTVFGEAITDYGFFHPRSGITDYDFTTTDFTADGSWHTKDLSSIVPDGAKAVLMSIWIADNAVHSYLGFTSDPYNLYLASYIATEVADVEVYGQYVIPCSSSRVIAYQAPAVTFQAIHATIIGWWK